MEEDDGFISFKWNNHKSSFCRVLSALRTKGTYTDATLACEGKFFPVHKLVMSTCSDYFGDVFERTTCRSPVIILKDIRHNDLESLLDYMYLGEVDVKQSELAGLIKTAECLRIKGLAVPDEEAYTPKIPIHAIKREQSSSANDHSSDEGGLKYCGPILPKNNDNLNDHSVAIAPSGGLQPATKFPSSYKQDSVYSSDPSSDWTPSKIHARKNVSYNNFNKPPKKMRLMKTGVNVPKRIRNKRLVNGSEKIAIPVGIYGPHNQRNIFPQHNTKTEELPQPIVKPFESGKNSNASGSISVADSSHENVGVSNMQHEYLPGPSGVRKHFDIESLLPQEEPEIITIPKFSEEVYPYLQGHDLFENDKKKFRRIIVDELIQHLNENNLLNNKNRLTQKKSYDLLQDTLLEAYPNMIVEESVRKKFKMTGRLGYLMTNMIEKRNYKRAIKVRRSKEIKPFRSSKGPQSLPVQPQLNIESHEVKAENKTKDKKEDETARDKKEDKAAKDKKEDKTAEDKREEKTAEDKKEEKTAEDKKEEKTAEDPEEDKPEVKREVAEMK